MCSYILLLNFLHFSPLVSLLSQLTSCEAKLFRTSFIESVGYLYHSIPMAFLSTPLQNHLIICKRNNISPWHSASSWEQILYCLALISFNDQCMKIYGNINFFTLTKWLLRIIIYLLTLARENLHEPVIWDDKAIMNVSWLNHGPVG